MVKDRTSLDKVVVTADGDGVVSHAGSALLVGLADKVGLTAALSAAMAPTRQRVSAHDPGVVLRDLAVMLADGATSLSGLGALRDQEALFGVVASDSTAYRVIDSIDQAGLERLREAVAIARGQAWSLGVGPKRVVMDFDATLLGSREALAGVLRDGNAGTAFVCELTGRVSLKSWPAGTRLICRAVRLAEGTQLGFGQTDGFRYEVFLTDLAGDVRDRDLFQRGHARVEDRIRDAKDLGLRNLPFREFSNNEVWVLLVLLAQDLLAWSQALLLTGDLARAEPATLRYRLWHTAAKLARHARRTHLRLDRRWPQAAAFTRLQALPRT